MWSKIHADRCPPGLFPEESIGESASPTEAAPLAGLSDANPPSKVLLNPISAAPFDRMQPQTFHQSSPQNALAPRGQLSAPVAKRIIVPKASTVVKRGIKRL